MRWPMMHNFGKGITKKKTDSKFRVSHVGFFYIKLVSVLTMRSVIHIITWEFY